ALLISRSPGVDRRAADGERLPSFPSLRSLLVFWHRSSARASACARVSRVPAPLPLSAGEGIGSFAAAILDSSCRKEPSMSASEPMGVAIVGSGMISEFQAKAIGALPDAYVAGFYDQVAELAERRA